VLDTAGVPDDIAALKAMLVAAEASNHRKDVRIAQLKKLVAAFKQDAFGRRSKKGDPDQFKLTLKELTAIAAVHAAEEVEDCAARRPTQRRSANHGAVPRHLPRIGEIIEPDIVSRRPKCCCRSRTDYVVLAPAPARLIPGRAADLGHGRPGSGQQICRSSSAYRQALIYGRAQLTSGCWRNRRLLRRGYTGPRLWVRAVGQDVDDDAS